MKPRTKRTRPVIEPLESRTLLSTTPGVWSTVDDYNLTPGKNAGSFALATDPAGDVFSAGYATDAAGHQHGIVREKAAGASSWTTIADYVYSAGQDTEFQGAAVAPNGTLYVTGYGRRIDSGASRHHWITLAVSPGSSPTLIDDFVPLANTDTYSTGVAIDSSGNVFTTGYAPTPVKKNSAIMSWFARKQTAGTGAFSTVDSYAKAGSDTNLAYGITIVNSGPNAGVYVGGVTFGTTVDWIIRKTGNGGATWSTVDDYIYPGGSGSARAMASDAAGNVYAVGSGADSAHHTHWVVRQSSNGGTSWSIVDDYQLSTAANSLAQGIGIDASGAVNVVGGAFDSTGVNHSILRNNSGGAFHVVDDYSLAPGQGGAFKAFATDPTGVSYTAGGSLDSTGTAHWIVRDPPTQTGAAVFSATSIHYPDASTPDDILTLKLHRHYRH